MFGQRAHRATFASAPLYHASALYAAFVENVRLLLFFFLFLFEISRASRAGLILHKAVYIYTRTRVGMRARRVFNKAYFNLKDPINALLGL